MSIRLLRSMCFALLLSLGWLQHSAGEPAERGSREAAGTPIRIAVLGDSLTAGYGLAPGDAFPAQLETALRSRGWTVEVLNHGVSGDTSAGGRNRVDWMLKDEPRVVVVELGANDALRGIAPEEMERNLDAILKTLKARGIAVLLTGMRAPNNYGRAYQKRYEAVFPQLADTYDVPLLPFFLQGVAGVPELNLGDGLHPNAEGVAEIVRRVLPLLEPLLARTVRNADGSTP